MGHQTGAHGVHPDVIRLLELLPRVAKAMVEEVALPDDTAGPGEIRLQANHQTREAKVTADMQQTVQVIQHDHQQDQAATMLFFAVPEGLPYRLINLVFSQ